MKILFASTAILASAFATAPAVLAQGSDDCSTATAIAGTGTFNFDTTAAITGTQGQAECGAIHNDVWYAWTAPMSGVAIVNTCAGASFDTKLAAYPGAACPADGTSAACNDDACGLQSQIQFAVTSGSVYMIQMGSYSSGASGIGSFDINVATIPSEDECATPGSWSGQGIFSYDCTLATTGSQGQTELNCDKFGQPGIGYDVWYSWTPTVSGFATFSTCGASWDTKVALWPGTGCPVDGTSITCNDDTCGLQSTIYSNVVAGVQYTLQLGSYPLTGSHNFADIDISIIPSGIGNNYCTNSANSTGFASGISASGSASLSDANLTLEASNAPNNQPGLFFFANNAASIPFGNGTLCAVGTIRRLPVIIESGGMYSYSLDFGTYGGYLGSGGASTYFQMWYRDPAGGGAFFNTSDGLEVVMTL